MSDEPIWIYLPINPDPWAIGPLSIGKRNGKFFPIVGRNNQLDAFKQAIREELESQDIGMVDYPTYRLSFWFWRRLDSNTAGTKKHVADTTNLQKATEDALQGVLIENDRNVVDVHSVTVAQNPTVKPGILIRIEDWELYGFDEDEIPDEMWTQINAPEVKAFSDNRWSGPV